MTNKADLIREFCIENTNQANIDKYSRYFKEGFNGYGIDTKVFETQRDKWISEWKETTTINDYLDLADLLVKMGKLEEVSFAIAFLQSERENYTVETFDRIGKWFSIGIDNWASTDVLCMMVLPSFFIDKVIPYEKLSEWATATSEWQRRCIPVTLDQLTRHNLEPEVSFELIEPLMLDSSEYVQKGIGTLLRGLWKKHPEKVESFLLNWKDECGRLIVQYATEKMDKEYRKRFRKTKK